MNTTVNVKMSKDDINSCTARLLSRRCNLTPGLAERIVEYRRKRGAIKHIDELWRIIGMKRAVFDKILENYEIRGQSPSPIGSRLPYEHTSSSVNQSRSLEKLQDDYAGNMYSFKSNYIAPKRLTQSVQQKQKQTCSKNSKAKPKSTDLLQVKGEHFPKTSSFTEINEIQFNISAPKNFQAAVPGSLVIEPSNSGQNLVLKYLDRPKSVGLCQSNNYRPPVSVGTQTPTTTKQIQAQDSFEELDNPVTHKDNRVQFEKKTLKKNETKIQKRGKQTIKRRRLCSDTSVLSNNKKQQIHQWLESVTCQTESSGSGDFIDAVENLSAETFHDNSSHHARKSKSPSDTKIETVSKTSIKRSKDGKISDKLTKSAPPKKIYDPTTEISKTNRMTTNVIDFGNRFPLPRPGTSKQHANYKPYPPAKLQTTQTSKESQPRNNKLRKFSMSHTITPKEDKTPINRSEEAISEGQNQEKNLEFSPETKGKDESLAKKGKRKTRIEKHAPKRYNYKKSPHELSEGCKIL